MKMEYWLVESHYANDLAHGSFKYWHDDGSFDRESIYENGNLQD